MCFRKKHLFQLKNSIKSAFLTLKKLGAYKKGLKEDPLIVPSASLYKENTSLK
tara:strand:+ start:456 stop:614 length:159 start_codon:yes stop_codon:yes gene_type:complete